MSISIQVDDVNGYWASTVSPLEGSGNLVGQETGVNLEGKGGEIIGRVYTRSNQGSLSTQLIFHALKQSNLFAKLATY